MDLVSWSLNAIDQIFSTRRQRRALLPRWDSGSWICDGFMGKMEDLLPASLYIQDTEDVYIFGLMITGFLLFGAGGYLVYRKIRKLDGSNSLCKDGMIRALNGLSATLGELTRRQDANLEQNHKLMDVSSGTHWRDWQDLGQGPRSGFQRGMPIKFGCLEFSQLR